MENNQPKTTPAQGVEEAQDILAKAKSNSKKIVAVSVLVLVCLVAVFAWFFIAKSGSAKADDAISRADAAASANDSTALVLYKDAAKHGYKSGNRAKLEVAMRLYQEGNYEEALSYLKGASIDDKIVAAGALTLEGDCYVNLKKYDEALSAFNKAVSKADENPSVVPVILVKEANVYRAQNNYAKEAETLKKIIDEYPQFASSNQVDVRKLYERAKASAE
ncbi:MAG: tetratricopeptide repeat protein [Muribaculaceae bacterium]